MRARRGLGVVIGSASICLASPLRAEDGPIPPPPRLADVACETASDAGCDTKTEVFTEYFVEDHDGFRIAYHPAARERVRDVAPKLDAIRAELASLVGARVLADVEIRVAALPIEVDRLAPVVSGPAHGGVTLVSQSLIVVSLAGSEAAGEDLEESLRHHLAHLAVAEATRGGDVPPWFEEGFAVAFARSRSWSRYAELELATLAGDPPSLAELQGSRRDARTEALAADFVRFAREEEAIAPLLQRLREGSSFDAAAEEAFGVDPSSIERAWRRDVMRRYGILPLAVLGALLLLAVLTLRWAHKRRLRRKERRERNAHRARSRVLARRRETKVRVPAHVVDHEVPRVEHDGSWHTLH